MTRQARLDAPGAVQHVIFRGVQHDSIFCDDVDREGFIERAGKVLAAAKASCYAFALLPGHVHLLLRAGSTPISDIMRRLLTGYSVSFNRRHGRSGHLFQNRYKSVLCEEEPYLLQLVRYIHLNPLRACVVSDLDSLDAYPYSGHSAIMGRWERPWVDSPYILMHFDHEAGAARTLYRTYVESGVSEGRRNDLTGGGFARSNRGWRPSPQPCHLKSDERILGSSRFVMEVMKLAKKTWDRTHGHEATGADFVAMQKHVAELFHLGTDEILLPGKYRRRAAARTYYATSW